MLHICELKWKSELYGGQIKNNTHDYFGSYYFAINLLPNNSFEKNVDAELDIVVIDNLMSVTI